MANLMIERLKRLPQRAAEVWQGEIVRMPTWITEEEPGPYRPHAALWVAVRDEFVGPMRMCSPQEATPGLLWDALVAFATDATFGGYRPGRVEVRDRSLAAALEPLAEVGIEVRCIENLDELDRVMASLMEHTVGGPLPPGMLSVAGVDLEQVRHFADAAREFHEAAPWRHLTDEDLLEVRSPVAPPGLRWATVLGAAGQSFGLGFFDEPEQLWTIHRDDPGEWLQERHDGVWSFQFGTIMELPLADADLWADEGLAVADASAYPCVIHFKPPQELKRPGPGELRYLEGLLRAIARSSETQIDSGRWTVLVPTTGGPTEFTLALPDLLDPPDFEEMRRRGLPPDPRSFELTTVQATRLLEERGPDGLEEANEILQQKIVGKAFDADRFAARDPLEAAQRLCYQAFDVPGRRRIQLARQAIETCPDCADAYVILAECANDAGEALDHYDAGVAAAERALGKERIEEDAGHFWGLVETRPYMRARFGLAMTLQTLGRSEEAVEHYRELLRLNPGDNQGVRYIYLTQLLELGRDEEAERYMAESDDEVTALWKYTAALLAFRRGGDTPASRKSLRDAIKSNPLAVDILADEAEDPEREIIPEAYALGSEEEAIICAHELYGTIEVTPGARAWLAARGRSTSTRPGSKKRRPRSSGKRKAKRR